MLRLCPFLAVLFLSVDFVRADDARDAFDSLFAAKIKAVSATADRADDIALGKEILALAKTSTKQAGLLILLCDAAHDLGAKHADGYAVSVEAMQLLAEHVEESRSATREKLIAILTRQSTAGKPDEREPAGEALITLLATIGDEKLEKKQYAEAGADYRRAVTVATQKKSASLDELKAKMDFALARDRTMKQLARSQEKLLANANDAAAALEIVKLYVIDLDDPAAAVPYLDRAKDERIKKIVPLAAKQLEETTEQECMELGEWYRSQVASAKGTAKQNVVTRAILFLERFTQLHTAEDIPSTKAKAYLNDLRTERNALAPRITTAKPPFKIQSRDAQVVAMIEELHRRDRKLFEGIKQLSISAQYDATRQPFYSREGDVKTIKGSLAETVFVGRPKSGAAVWGPNGTLEAGRYLVVARLMSMLEVEGNVGWNDVVNGSNDNVIVPHTHFSAKDAALGKWYLHAVTFKIDTDVKGVQYRFLQTPGVASVAFDRIYVFKLE